jgi:anthranilate phosphoribosyltransferase
LLSLDARLSFPVESLPDFLPVSPFLFLFAPHYHPALAHIAPIRRQLNFRTIFNILGPLINPATPDRMVLGVAKKELGETYAQVLKLLGVERALVVCGKEGLDEISPAGETWTWWLENGEISTGSIHPTEDFGLPLHALSSVRGATPELNSLTFQAILSNSQQPPPHLSSPPSPDSPSLQSITDYVLLNAAAVLRVCGKAESYKEGVAIARGAIENGNAWDAWTRFRDQSKKAMGEDVGVKVVEDDGGVPPKTRTVKSRREPKHGHEEGEKKEAKS